MSDSNRARGRNSKDAKIGTDLVEFINRSATPYPVESGAPAFDLVPVTKQKDIMVNVARLHAKQEYNRIMELVSVLQRQAEEIQHRLDITDQVHAARYDFQLYHNQTYWLLFDTEAECTRLSHQGPTDWYTGKPKHYEYICQVKWLGDYTWIEVDSE